jgi:hypothetical protein
MAKSAPKKWRVRELPGFSAKTFTSERTARKELARIAEKIHLDDALRRNVLMINIILVEYDEGDGWVEFLKLTPDALVALHKESSA